MTDLCRQCRLYMTPVFLYISLFVPSFLLSFLCLKFTLCSVFSFEVAFSFLSCCFLFMSSLVLISFCLPPLCYFLVPWIVFFSITPSILVSFFHSLSLLFSHLWSSNVSSPLSFQCSFQVSFFNNICTKTQ